MVTGLLRVASTVEALVIIALLAISIASTIAFALKAQHTAGWLLVPYLVWVSYATTRNAWYRSAQFDVMTQYIDEQANA